MCAAEVLSQPDALPEEDAGQIEEATTPRAERICERDVRKVLLPEHVDGRRCDARIGRADLLIVPTTTIRLASHAISSASGPDWLASSMIAMSNSGSLPGCMVSATRCSGITHAGMDDCDALRCSRASRWYCAAWRPLPCPALRTACRHALRLPLPLSLSSMRLRLWFHARSAASSSRARGGDGRLPRGRRLPP